MIDFTDKIHYIFHYDLPNERAISLPIGIKGKIVSMRVKIFSYLMKNKCIPLSESVYRIPNEQVLMDLKNKVEEWKKEYLNILDLDGDGRVDFINPATGLPFNPKMLFFPIKTTEIGERSFQDSEAEFLLSWLVSIQKSLQKVLDENKNVKDQYVKDKGDKIQLIESIAREDLQEHKLFDLIMDNLIIVKDLLYQVMR